MIQQKLQILIEKINTFIKVDLLHFNQTISTFFNKNSHIVNIPILQSNTGRLKTAKSLSFYTIKKAIRVFVYKRNKNTSLEI